MFKKVINGDKIVRDWNEAHMISIFLKGDKEKCQNYRGIAVILTMAKLYGRILKVKLKDKQAGLSAGKSCIDHIKVKEKK